MFVIRRTRDQRPIAGIFTQIKTPAMAERILAQWQHNYPQETFHIEKQVDTA
jgi:hypothetical protein